MAIIRVFKGKSSVKNSLSFLILVLLIVSCEGSFQNQKTIGKTCIHKVDLYKDVKDGKCYKRGYCGEENLPVEIVCSDYPFLDKSKKATPTPVPLIINTPLPTPKPTPVATSIPIKKIELKGKIVVKKRNGSTFHLTNKFNPNVTFSNKEFKFTETVKTDKNGIYSAIVPADSNLKVEIEACFSKHITNIQIKGTQTSQTKDIEVFPNSYNDIPSDDGLVYSTTGNGKITTKDGKAIEKAVVTLTKDEMCHEDLLFSTETNQKGEYFFNYLAGLEGIELKLKADHPNFISKTKTFVYGSNKDGNPLRNKVDFELVPQKQG